LLLNAGQKGDTKETARRVLETINVDKSLWQIGNNKVFMKNAVENALEAARGGKLAHRIIKLQAFGRMVVCKAKYRRSLKNIRIIQRGN
jgi:myosin heavy subunit